MLFTRSEVGKHPGGAQGYLRERNPQWRFVGRVTFHLAENKRDPDYPFAFLATFANGLTPQGKVRHEPLGRALQQYAGEQNREAMLNLLLPISKAAESSELIRRLVDSERDLSPPRLVAERSLRVHQSDTPVRIERFDRPGAGLVERPEAAPAPRQREDQFEEFGRHRRRCDDGVLGRHEPRRRNAQPG